jgi:hypothetical protein
MKSVKIIMMMKGSNNLPFNSPSWGAARTRRMDVIDGGSGNHDLRARPQPVFLKLHITGI